VSQGGIDIIPADPPWVYDDDGNVAIVYGIADWTDEARNAVLGIMATFARDLPTITPLFIVIDMTVPRVYTIEKARITNGG